MKKLLTSLLALLTCFACATAVACGESGNNSSNTGNSNTGSSDTGSSDTGSEDDELQDAVDYLETLYKEQNVETRQDYEVLPAIMGYPITWTVDVASGVTIKVEDNKVIVDVDELLDENLTYVLTATVADGDRTVTVSFTRVVLAAPSIIPVAITEAPQAGVAYKYHVYQSTLAQDMYFAGGMAATYYFSTTTNWEEGVDVYAEYVADSTTDFYLYFVKDGVNQYLGVKVSDDGAHDNIIYGTEKVSTFVWNADLGTVTTHLEATKNNGGPNDFYFGNYGDKTTISCSYTSYAGGAGNNVGHLVTMVDKNSITPDVKVAESKAGLALSKTEFVGAAEVELPVARHADVAVAWACESEFVSIADGKLTITAPTAETTVTLTATLTCGEVSDTTEFTLTLKPAVSIPEAGSTLTIPQANEIGVALGGEYTEGMYYVSGVVSSVKNTQYGNLYIKDADGNEFYVYGVYSADGSTRYDAMENAPQVGDTITVYGIIGSYNGSAQMKNGWMTAYTAGEGGGEVTPPTTEDPAADSVLTISQALALGASKEHNTYTTGKYYVVGTIKNVYNTQYGNMYIQDADGNEFCVYGLYSADGTTRYDAMATKPVAGDTVKVYGIIGQYNGTAQMKNGWLAEHTAHEHNYVAVVTEPTCTMAGYTTHTCSACEDSYKDTEVAALGHTTEEGFCERCQQTVGGDVVVAQYEKVTSASEFTTGTYVLVVNTKNITVSTFDGSWVKGSELSADNIIDKATGDALAITLEVSDAGVKIKIGDTYVKPKGGNNNGISAGDYTWAYEFQADGTIVFNGVGSDTVSLAYNVQSAGFRAYKTSTISGNASGYPSFFTAYKLVG